MSAVCVCLQSARAICQDDGVKELTGLVKEHLGQFEVSSTLQDLVCRRDDLHEKLPFASRYMSIVALLVRMPSACVDKPSDLHLYSSMDMDKGLKLSERMQAMVGEEHVALLTSFEQGEFQASAKQLNSKLEAVITSQGQAKCSALLATLDAGFGHDPVCKLMFADSNALDRYRKIKLDPGMMKDLLDFADLCADSSFRKQLSFISTLVSGPEL